jgi:hypothetical protein
MVGLYALMCGRMFMHEYVEMEWCRNIRPSSFIKLSEYQHGLHIVHLLYHSEAQGDAMPSEVTDPGGVFGVLGVLDRSM